MEKKILALFLALIISYILTPLVKKIAINIGAVDKPNERKVHKGNIPRLGGVAIYIAFVSVMLAFSDLTSQMIGILIGGTIIMALGIIDDLIELSPKYKLLGQILAAIIIIISGVKVNVITNPIGSGSIPLGFLSIPITILWIIGIINAINLIDGLDGLASGVSIIALGMLAVTSWLSGQHTILVTLCLAASTLGFLRYNFNPAKIFLGDSGSMFLGFNLAALSILGMTKSAAMVSVFIPIVILGIPISDTFIAVVRRYINGQSIFKADKGHLHHQLLALGMSQKQAVLTIYVICIFFGAVAFVLTKISTTQALIVFLALATVIAIIAGKMGMLVKHHKGIGGQINWMEQLNDKYHKGI